MDFEVLRGFPAFGIELDWRDHISRLKCAAVYEKGGTGWARRRIKAAGVACYALTQACKIAVFCSIYRIVKIVTAASMLQIYDVARG